MLIRIWSLKLNLKLTVFWTEFSLFDSDWAFVWYQYLIHQRYNWWRVFETVHSHLEGFSSSTLLLWTVFFSLLPQDYHLPNQPVHTVDINITPSHLRPHPPINRTQSSPSLYSSNLIRSPLGTRRKTSTSAKVPRPPTSSLNSEEGLPPRPPARGVRRPLELNPVFSSGTSWRKRKWLKWSGLNGPHYLQTNYVTNVCS